MLASGRVKPVLFTALAASVLWTGCGGDRITGAPPPDNDPRVGEEPPGQTFFFDPARFIGEDITATGYVSDLHSPFAFRIAGDRLEGPGVLVVSTRRIDLEENDLVQVFGRVRWFSVDQFVRDFDIPLDPATFHEFEGAVALAASEVTVNGIGAWPGP